MIDAATSATSSGNSRRDFLKTSTAAVVGGAVVAEMTRPTTVHAAGSDILKVGLIGCGGRGLGAAVNAMNAEDNVRLTALGDAFSDQVEHARGVLSKQVGAKYAVEADHCFAGLDAYQKVIDSGVDVVLLCTPTYFRPVHLRAAIDAGKHVFCEKPVAVDGPGIRSVLESTRKAKEKKLTIVSGLCWRYDLGVRETIKRIQDGEIGDVVTIQENYLTGTLWHRDKQPNWTPMEYQVRNWLYYTWLSGDHIVEQHIHSLDKALWLYGDQAPVKCFGLGGRQMRVQEQYGNAFDHFAVCYEWADGRKCFSYTRQMADCANDVDDYVMGTKGRAVVLRHQIQDAKGETTWRYRGPKPSMYDYEHKELFAGIRSGNIINNGEYMAASTLMAIMGREACYTGQNITSEQLLKSEVSLGPAKVEWGGAPTVETARPGVTKSA
ncbi:MAG: Gfo/Idh/MocA family protein [Planctomycetota bacterium]